MFVHNISPKKKTKQTIFLDRSSQPETKIKSRFQWLLGHIITVFSCVLIIALGIAVLTHANPGTTTIGENISTGGNLTVGGNATTTGSHYFGSDLSIFGNVGIGTTTPNYNFVVNGTTNNFLQVASSTNQGIFVIDLGGNIGIDTTDPEHTISFGGDDARTIGIKRETTGAAGNDLTISAGGTTSGETDKAGGNLYLASGISTGAGANNIYFQTAPGSQQTGGLKTVSIYDGGYDYVVGDVLTLDCGTGGTVTVTSVDGGVITGVEVTDSGSGYRVPDSLESWNIVTATGGTGEYAYFFIEEITVGSDDNALSTVMTITKDGRVGIGTTEPGALLDIEGSFTHACASNPSWTYQYYTGVNYNFTVDPSSDSDYGTYYGSFQNTEIPESNTNNIGGIVGSTNIVELGGKGSVEGGTASIVQAMIYQPTDDYKAGGFIVDNADTVSDFAYGIQSTVNNVSYGAWYNNGAGGTASIGTARAARHLIQNATQNGAAGAATMTTGQAIYANILNENATMGTAVGFQYDLKNTTGASITNSYGIKLTAPDNAGTITNHYGLYLADQTVSGTTNNFAIYSGGGKNYFADNVGIGTTTPQTKLEVAGTGYFSDKVGIGTMNPDTLFHVSNNTATTTITIGDGLTGGKGACLKLRDSDDAGWTYCSVLDGVMTCGTDSCE